jgi:hypothetical protein
MAKSNPGSRFSAANLRSQVSLRVVGKSRLRLSLVAWTSSKDWTESPPFEELRARATETEVLGVSVAVCSIEDLKAMKQAAGRTRDLADLEDLDAAGS